MVKTRATSKLDLGSVAADIIAYLDDTYDLGSASIRWKTIFVVTAVLTSLIIGGAIKLSNVDGTLFINASTEINGSLTVRDNVTASYYHGDGSLLTGIATNDTKMKGDNIYLYNDTTTMYFNESRMNDTIDARDSGDTDTKWITQNIYIYNDSTDLIFNETQLNATCDARDSDTTYDAGEIYIYESSDVFYLNETPLNDTIDARENDTTYTGDNKLYYLDGTEFKYNLTYAYAEVTVKEATEARTWDNFQNVNGSDIVLQGTNMALNWTTIDARDDDTTYTNASFKLNSISADGNIDVGSYNITAQGFNLGDDEYACFGDSGCADSSIHFNGSTLIIKVN